MSNEQRMIAFDRAWPRDVANQVNDFLAEGWVIIKDNMVTVNNEAGFMRSSGYFILERVKPVVAADAGPVEGEGKSE